MSLKKISIIGVLIIVVMLMSACAPAVDEPTEAPAAPTEAPAEPTMAMEEPTQAVVEPTEAPAEVVPDLSGMKVAYIFPGVINDGSYNTLGYTAMEDVQKKFGLEVQWNERVQPADAPRVIGEFATSGVDAVWAHSGTFLEPVMNTAPNFPDISFVTYAGVLQENPPANIWQQLNLEGHRQMFFMSGVLAGLMTESNVIGFTGGVELTTYSQGMDSFEMGAKWVNPDAKVLRVWTGNFDDAPKAKEATIGHIEQGADVITHATNLGVYGIVEAVEENPGVYFIGKDIDQAPLLPDRTLVSMFINYSHAMSLLLPQIHEGTLGGIYVSDLANGGTTMTDLASFIPEEKASVYNKVLQMVTNDEINVRGPAAEVTSTLPSVPAP